MIHAIPESVHAILSPSKAHLWMACKGGLAAAKGVPNRPSKYAAEGTAYHDVARRALTEDKDCDAYIGDRYQVGEFSFTIDADNAEYAQMYVDAVRSIPGKRFIEVDLEYSKLLGVPKTHVVIDNDTGKVIAEIPVAAGTGDCVILDYENKIIHSYDLKFGRGDVVYASQPRNDGTDLRDPNPQLALYAAAAVDRYELLGIEDDWWVHMGIHQPRAQHYDGHRMRVGELKQWVLTAQQPANRAYVLWTRGPERVDPTLDLTPGEKQCRWCPISGNCKAQTDKILNLFPKGHAAEAVPLLTQLDTTELADALDRAEEVDHWLSAVRAEGLRRALGGHVVPRWKIVQGRRGNRALNEEAQVQLDVPALLEIGIEDPEEPSALPIEDAIHFALGDAAYKKELLSASQLEKKLTKKAPLLWAALQEHITQADGKPALERMEDPRPPLAIVTQEFPVVGSQGGASGLL